MAYDQSSQQNGARVDKLEPFEEEEEQTAVFDEVENVHGCLVDWQE